MTDVSMKDKPANREWQTPLPGAIVLGLALAVMAYATYRAVHLSMTHDECGTWKLWTHFPIFKCYWSPDCWGTANLHWLYVLLMQLSAKLFGEWEWALRLPSLLALAVYLWYGWRIVDRWASTGWMVVVGFIFFISNRYLLDFFSLARGYGLAVSMMVFSLYNLGRYLEQPAVKWLVGAMGGACLAVLANFTMLPYLAALVVLLVSFWFLENYRSGHGFPEWRSHVSVVVLSCGVLAWLIYRPIGFLLANREFEYGTDSLIDTFKSLISNSLYGIRYVHMYNLELFGIPLLALLIAASVHVVKKLHRRTDTASDRLLGAVLFLGLMITFSQLAQHLLTGSKYMVNRTALIFVPLAVLSVFLYGNHLAVASRHIAWRLVPVALGLFCVVHFSKIGEHWKVREWYYDAFTKDVMMLFWRNVPEEEKISLGLHWIYHPAASYYYTTRKMNFLSEPLLYSKSILPEKGFDYYYVDPGESAQLHERYDLVLFLNYEGILFRRKDLPPKPEWLSPHTAGERVAVPLSWTHYE